MSPLPLPAREESHEERDRGTKIIAFLASKSKLYYGKERRKFKVNGWIRGDGNNGFKGVLEKVFTILNREIKTYAS